MPVRHSSQEFQRPAPSAHVAQMRVRTDVTIDEEMMQYIAQLAAREARAVVNDLLDGLDQRIIDVVDGRMREWMDPVSENLQQMREQLTLIARQQGADVEARVEHERWLAEKAATEEAEQRIRQLEDRFQKEREHYANLSMSLTQRQREEAEARQTGAETKELPAKARASQWAVAAKVIGAIALLLTALGVGTIWSQCRGPNREPIQKQENPEKMEKARP